MSRPERPLPERPAPERFSTRRSRPNRALAVRTSLVSAATLGSRVLGFAREAATAAMLGVGPVADALTAALALPLLARRLLAEGAFNLAFIPALVRAERQGPAAGRALALATLLLLGGLLLILALAAALLMPQLIGLLAPGFAPDGPRADAAILCGRVAVLYLPLAGLAAIHGGIANAAHRVMLAALAPMAANLTVLLAILGLLARGAVAGETAALAIAAATVVAGLSQVLVMKAAARGCPAVPRLSQGAGALPWRVALAVMRAAAPALLFAGISQFRIMIAAALASGTDGAVAALNYAQRLIDLPLGLVGASAGAVLVPLLARRGGAQEGGAAAASGALLTALAFALPAGLGLAVLADPIVAVVFQRGAFDAADARATAGLLAVLALALPVQGLERILSAAAAAGGQVVAAERIALASLVLCAAAGAGGVAGFGPLGAAAAVGLSALASAAALMVLLVRRRALEASRRALLAAAGLVACAAAMTAAVAATDNAFAAAGWAPAAGLGGGPRLAALVALGVGVYGGCALGLKALAARIFR